MRIAIALITAVLITSLMEYWGHRLMHRLPNYCQFHVEHHQDGTGQGVLKELRDYAIGGLPALLLSVLLLRFLGCDQVIIASWLMGCLLYIAFAAYAHQLQHDNPRRCSWMAMPVHFVHHRYNQWHHNFGIGLDLWDRLFGTYQAVDWQPSVDEAEPRGYFQIRWW
jgi:sterol desaturase/sphingolipid hydroxylase (fatty acid hydroxylase superfamily)